MRRAENLVLTINREKVVISISTILYVQMTGNNAKIHVCGGMVYEVRMPLLEIEQALGDSFIQVRRGCMVSAMAIHDIRDKVILSNGEQLEYTTRKKSAVMEEFHAKQQEIIRGFAMEGIPATPEEYRAHYQSFENVPFAFTDIEMVFDETRHAVDWVFRYGNPALARLEKMPLERLIGSSFGSLFANMDSKWLRSYERATLYGETLEIIDYSPEIDTYLKVICFPTFRGHCGCLLFDISQIKFTKNSSDAEKALLLYFGQLPNKE